MKFHSTANTVVIPEKGQTDFVTFDLVSELLALPFTGYGEEVIVEAKSQDFFCVPESGIQATTTLKAEVYSEDIVETNGQLEVTVSGKVNNQQGHSDTFSLFFFMCLNDSVPSFLRSGVRNILKSSPLLLRPKYQTDKLYNSLFTLTLYCKKPPGQLNTLGQGRGFLLLGRDNSMNHPT
jgi:hypothetical protein